MAIITFDCDEVLAELIKSMLDRHNNTFLWIPLAWDEIVDYYVENIPKIKEQKISFDASKQVFDEVILDHGTISPVAGMDAIVRGLKNQWHELYVITARGDELQEATIQWIETHYPKMFSDIILANHYNENSRCKWDICHYLWSELMFEDTIHNSEKIIAKDIPVIMPNKPWNKGYESGNNIHKVDRVEQMKEILVKKGFL